MEITSGVFKASMGISVLTEGSLRKQDYFICPGNFTTSFSIRSSTGICIDMFTGQNMSHSKSKPPWQGLELDDF